MILPIHPRVAFVMILPIRLRAAFLVLDTSAFQDSEWVFFCCSHSSMEKPSSQLWMNRGVLCGKTTLGVPIILFQCPGCLHRAVTAASQDGSQELMRWGCFPHHIVLYGT